jgi:hypothetical protein
VIPLLPEPPDSGTEQPWMRHAPCVTTPESPVPERRAVHSSPLVNCGSSLRLGHRD